MKYYNSNTANKYKKLFNQLLKTVILLLSLNNTKDIE